MKNSLQKPGTEFEVNPLLDAALFKIAKKWESAMVRIYQKEISSPFENTGKNWRCKTFEVQAYHDSTFHPQIYNFKYKDIHVSWYKYLGRGMSVNRVPAYSEIENLLVDCLEALSKMEKEELITNYKYHGI